MENLAELDSPFEKLSPEEALQAIQGVYPELEIKNLVPLEMGTSNHVFDADGRYIFRFPREEGKNTLARERFVLERLASKISVEVPRLEFYSNESPRFSGYPKLQGHFLRFKELEDMPAEQRKLLAEDIALFFEELHSAMTVAKAREGGVPEIWNIPRSLSKVREAFSSPPDQEVLGFIAAVEECMRQHPVPERDLMLIHNDFHDGNMLVDSESRLKGVIDFDNVVVGDVHQEFMQLYKRNPDFTRTVAEAYAKRTGREVDMEAVSIYTAVRLLRKLMNFRNIPSDEKYLSTQEYLREWVKW